MRKFFLCLLCCASCLRVETNALDTSALPGALLYLLSARSPEYYLFTNTNKLLVTSGGGSYTARTFTGITSGRADGAAVSGGVLAAVNSTDPGPFYSTDGGRTFSAGSGTTMGAGTKTLKSCGSGFSAAGINGTNLVAASSPDGRTWTQTSTGFASPTVYGAGCHGSSYLLAYTTTGGPLTGTIGVSTDGRNYSQVAVGGTEVPMGVASSGSVIMALDPSSDYYTSANSGASYSGAAAIGQASPWRSLVYSNGRFYAIFYSAPNCNILFSTGGAWSSAGSFSCAASPTWNGALASGSLILIVGTVSSTPLVIRSTDGGSTWTQDSISESGVTSIADALVP